MRHFHAAGATLLSLALVVGMGGCGSYAQKGADAAGDVREEVLDGGWTIPTATSVATDEQRQLFEDATKDVRDGELKPVAVVATTPAPDERYAYLTQVTRDGSSCWALAVVTRDADGTSDLSALTNLDLADLHILEDAAGPETTTSWELAEPRGGEGMLGDVVSAFELVTAHYEGAAFKPCALLATQVVAGINYKILAVGTTIGAHATKGLYVLDIYLSLQNDVELTDVERLDLAAYLSS